MILNIIITFAIIMLPCAVFLFIGRVLSKDCFKPSIIFFRENKLKNWICKITNVKKWKNNIPVGGRVAGFRLNNLTNPRDVEFLDRFIYESCFAEWLHSTCIVWGLLSLLLFIFLMPNLFLTIALPSSIIFAYQNIVSVLIQWYTRPKIIKLKENIIKRNEKKTDI